jgi:hypothetical protein
MLQASTGFFERCCNNFDTSFGLQIGIVRANQLAILINRGAARHGDMGANTNCAAVANQWLPFRSGPD